MEKWESLQVILIMVAVALVVTWFSNRNKIPYVNPGRTWMPLGATRPPAS